MSVYRRTLRPSTPANSDLRSSIEEVAVEPFPVYVLPDPARKLVEETAASLCCPPDLIAVPQLAVLGAAIGRAWEIEVKDGWREPAVIYAAVVARPGEKKSPAQRFATEPLHVAQLRSHDAYMAAVRQQQAEKGNRQSEPGKEACNNARKAPKESSDHSAPQPIARRCQYYCTDVTIEAMALLLRQTPRGILYEQDELSALTASFNRYRKGLGAQAVLQLRLEQQPRCGAAAQCRPGDPGARNN